MARELASSNLDTIEVEAAALKAKKFKMRKWRRCLGGALAQTSEMPQGGEDFEGRTIPSGRADWP